MSIVVFLGPTLDLATARRELDAIYLPPCAMGDLYAAVQRHKPQVIGLVDGLFESTPAVWHKEILHALSQGIEVFGASSMGALRAAELDAFGMRGVGGVYAALRDGTLEDDDEVAVAHLGAADGWRAVSEPMVNLRHGLALARAEGLLGADIEQRLVAAMKALYYPERSWAALWSAAAAVGLPAGQIDDLRLLVETRRPDRKRDDALALLAAVRARAATRASAPKPAFEFESTLFWEHLVACRATVGAPAGGVARERLVDHVRVGAPDRASLLNDALLLELAEQAGRRLGLPPIDDRAALARFRRERGLQSVAALNDWMAREQVDRSECLELARAEERLRALQWRLQEQVNGQLPRALRLRGRFEKTAAAVRAQWDAVRGLGIDGPGAGDVDSIDAVLQWYQQRSGTIHGDLEAHVVERGFGTPRQFMTELLAQYLAERAAP